MPEKTSMPVISTDADTVALESARMKWEIMPTSTMMYPSPRHRK